MSSVPSPWPQLVVPIGITGFFVVTCVFYSLWPARSRPLDSEVTARPASMLLGRHFRHYFVWLIGPVERACARADVSPAALTAIALLASGAAGVLLAFGSFAAGGWLYIVSGIFDVLDGRVARATGRSSRAGAFLDSVTDRYVETAIFGGLAWYYRAEPALFGIVLLAVTGSLLVSYVRARGEALGVDVRVGTMQRPERLVWLGGVLAHAPLVEILARRVVPAFAWPPGAPGAPLYPPVVATLLLIGLSSHWTALRRARHTLRALDAPVPAKVSVAERAPVRS